MLKSRRRRSSWVFAASVLVAMLVPRTLNADGEGSSVSAWVPPPETGKPILCLPRYWGGEAALAGNVATVQFLQIFTTLRVEDRGRVFQRNGLMLWGEQPLDQSGHVPAALWGEKYGCRTVLWGSVHRFGDSLIAQAQFTVLPPTDRIRPERPSLSSPKFGTVTLELPATRYTFTPAVLTREVAEKYSSPNSLVMYRQPAGRGGAVGPVGLRFRSLIATESTVKVTSEGKTGWLDLPHLAKNRSETVDFVSAFLRTLRRDYQGAAQYYERVLENPEASVSVRSDVNLYLAIGDLQSGLPGEARTHVQKALELDPYASSAHRFAVYVELVFAVSNGVGERLRKALEAAKEYVPDADPVMVAAQKLASR